MAYDLIIKFKIICSIFEYWRKSWLFKSANIATIFLIAITIGHYASPYKTENKHTNKNEAHTKTNNPSDSTDKKQLPKSYSPQEVEEAAQFASSITGVRKDYLMGMLTVETNLGQNVGECTYQQVAEDAQNRYEQGQLSQTAWNTFLSRSNTFQKIAQSLDYDYQKLQVSCSPPYAGTGGAMGIGQFMPSTWMEYHDRIAAAVGKENPDPWDPRDGAVAMAIKLSDVPGVTQHNIWSERNAAKMYLSGSSSRAYEWYANQAIYWSRNYQILLANAGSNSSES